MILKIAAITDPEQYRWKALIEVNFSVLDRLSPGFTKDYQPPQVGKQIDITPVFQRLLDLERREEKLKEFGKLLAAFLPAQPDTEKLKNEIVHLNERIDLLVKEIENPEAHGNG